MPFNNYSQLSTVDSPSSELNSESSLFTTSDAPPSPPPGIQMTPTIAYLGLAAILSITINLVLLSASVPSTYSLLYRPNPAVPIRNLGQPSPYIGLDRVVRFSANSSTTRKNPLQRTNFPDVLLQINSRDNVAVTPLTIDRISMFHVTEKISMIAQSRAADYGLVHCSIGSIIPSINALFNTTKVYSSTGNTQHLHIDVWQLAFETELDRNVLSRGRHVPSSLSMPRQRLLGRLNMSAGDTSRTPDFTCVTGTWYTFEFSASSKNIGEVMFRQDYAYPTLGVYMHQKEA